MMKKVVFVSVLVFNLFTSDVFGMQDVHEAYLSQLFSWLSQSPVAQKMLEALNPDSGFLDKFNLVVDFEVTYDGDLDNYIKPMLILLYRQFSTVIEVLRSCLAEFDKKPHLFVEDETKKNDLLQKMKNFVDVKDQAFAAFKGTLNEEYYEVLDDALKMHQLFYCAVFMVPLIRFLLINDKNGGEEVRCKSDEML